MEENIEFKELRQQINLLKSKLEKEEIVNEKLLRSSMRQRVSVIRRHQIIEYCCVLYVISFGSLTFYNMGCSLAFIIGTIALMLIIAMVNFFIHQNFNNQNWYGDDLLIVAKNMRQLKQNYIRYLFFGIPALIAWATWFAFELSKTTNAEMLKHMFIACGIGLIIGAIFGFIMFTKNLNACKDIINQIEEG